MKIEIAKAIASMVEGFLPRFSENKVMCISIDARVFCFEEKWGEKDIVRGIHFAISRPSNYTCVVMAEKDDVALTFDERAVFKFCSDHDSCWRQDGIHSPLFDIRMRMLKELDPGKKEPSWFTSISQVKIVDGNIKVDRNKNYEVTLYIGKEEKR